MRSTVIMDHTITVSGQCELSFPKTSCVCLLVAVVFHQNVKLLASHNVPYSLLNRHECSSVTLSFCCIHAKLDDNLTVQNHHYFRYSVLVQVNARARPAVDPQYQSNIGGR